MTDRNKNLTRLFVKHHGLLEDVLFAGRVQAAHGFALFGFFKLIRTDWDKGILDCIQSSDFQLGLNHVVGNSLSVASACKKLRALTCQYEEKGDELLKFLYDLPGVFQRLFESELELISPPVLSNHEFCEFIRKEVNDAVLLPSVSYDQVERLLKRYMFIIAPDFDYLEALTNPFYRY